MNYAKLRSVDISNGSGVRVSLFVSGCNNHCKGCFNPETWDFKYGKRYHEVDTTNKILKLLDHDYISGLTILGGEPLDVKNLGVVTNLCWIVKHVYPDKTIWLYTGDIYENVKYLEVINYIDVLVDGAFVEELKDISLTFRGSSNQRIIDVKKSLKQDMVVEVIL